MSERKRLTDTQAAQKWDSLGRYVESTDERDMQRVVRADHLQAREDVKRLASALTFCLENDWLGPKKMDEFNALLDEVKTS